MRPYSTDLRLKVVRAYERGHGSQRQLAQFFGVSVSFVHELLRRYRQRGSVEPKPHGGGKPAKLGSHIAVVRQLHQQQPDASLARCCEQLAATAGVRGSRATMQRGLRRVGGARGGKTSPPPGPT